MSDRLMTTVRRGGQIPPKGICAKCGEVTTDEHFCHGCRTFICPNCDMRDALDVPWEKLGHLVGDHGLIPSAPPISPVKWTKEPTKEQLAEYVNAWIERHKLLPGDFIAAMTTEREQRFYSARETA